MKIAIIGRNYLFIEPLLAELKQYHEIKVLARYTPIDPIWELSGTATLMRWSDVAFFEFLQEPLPYASFLDGIDTPIVARVHGYDVFTFPKVINWSKVHTLIGASPLQLWIDALNYTELIKSKRVTLPIGTNPGFFTPLPDKEFGRNICIEGSISPRKRSLELVEDLEPLLKDGWNLWIRGPLTGFRDENAHYKHFLAQTIDKLGLTESVHIVNTPYPLPPVEVYRDFLQSMDVIVSNSMMEGYQVSVFDGMSVGLFPIVYNWLGADTMFPEQYIFKNGPNLIDKLKTWDYNSNKAKLSLSRDVRDLVVKDHDERKVVVRIREILEEAGSKA